MTERRAPTAHPIRDLLRFWDDLYKCAHDGMKYPVTGKDAKLMEGLRELYADDQIKSFMVVFFEMDDPFFTEAGRSLGVFRGCLPKVIQCMTRGPNAKAVPKHLMGIQEWMSRKARGE